MEHHVTQCFVNLPVAPRGDWLM